MLLESNNIHFESKLGNLRQMVPKLFSSNEKPIIDDFLQDDVETNNMNMSNDDDGGNSDGSWNDVKEIFETFNKQTVIPQTSNQGQQRKLLDERQNRHSLRQMVKDQNNKLHHSKDKATKEICTPESVYEVERGEENANKENIRDPNDQRTSSDLASQYQLQSSNYSGQGSGKNVESIQTQNKNIPSSSSVQASTVGDQSNRVRQVNVEMFTVTLKCTDRSKDKSVNENH